MRPKAAPWRASRVPADAKRRIAGTCNCLSGIGVSGRSDLVEAPGDGEHQEQLEPRYPRLRGLIRAQRHGPNDIHARQTEKTDQRNQPR